MDVRVAATWMRDGGRALFEASAEDLRRHSAAALDDETDYWPRTDGPVRDRWRLWAERLHALSMKTRFEEETRKAVKEAAEVVEDILGETGWESTVKETQGKDSV